jgi:hypothetical protein
MIVGVGERKKSTEPSGKEQTEKALSREREQKVATQAVF